MNYHDAFIHIQDASPHVDVRKALEFLKAQKNIEFNQLNEVFTFVVSRNLKWNGSVTDSTAGSHIHKCPRSANIYPYTLDTDSGCSRKGHSRSDPAGRSDLVDGA